MTEDEEQALSLEDWLQLQRHRLDAAIAAEDGDGMSKAILAITYNDPVTRRIEDACIKLLTHPHDQNARRLGAVCMGHIVTYNNTIDVERVTPILLQVAAEDPGIAPAVSQAFADFSSVYPQFAPRLQPCDLPGLLRVAPLNTLRRMCTPSAWRRQPWHLV